jgi:Zn-dependent protease with chaperone function
LVAVVAMRWLPRASWPLRAPRTGIVVWLALSLTVIVSAVLAGLVLAMPCMRISIDPAVLRACLLIARARYATPAGAAAGVAGGLFVLAVLARLTWFTASALACAMRRRARHDDTLAVVARPGPAPGTVLLDEEQPVAYCLPGRRRIVITTGAMRCLDSRQFDAVVAHERAHLAGRHHLVLACSAALSRAFPHVRLFAVAAAQIRSLVEMAADDAAVRRGHRLDLAGALLALAAPPVPAGALAAAGTAAAERVRRLLAAPHPASIRRRALTAAAALAAASVLVCAPALAVISVSHCPARAGHHLTAAVSTGEEGR